MKITISRERDHFEHISSIELKTQIILSIVRTFKNITVCSNMSIILEILMIQIRILNHMVSYNAI